MLTLPTLFCLATLASALSGHEQDGPPQQPLLQDHTPPSALPQAYPRLNFSSPSPLIFHSLFTLLHQWPQTFHPNSHTIAPCTIPRNTNLYHARLDQNIPPSPEWFAFDAEMSYAIAGVAPTSHMLTYRTTREVRCLYFDGTSASLADDGSMDAQMLLLHNTSANVPPHPGFGEPPPDHYYHGNGSYPYPTRPCPPGSNGTNCSHWNPLKAEYDRATGLCEFIRNNSLGGLGWGYEGVVRMNTGFEMIWCNFSSPSAKLISNLKVGVPLLDIEESGDGGRTAEGKVGREQVWYDHRADHGIGGMFHDPTANVFEATNRTKPPPPGQGQFMRLPFLIPTLYNWFHAATKRYGFAGVGHPGQGETRVRIDSSAIFTFYDAGIVHQERARVEQEKHRLNLTEEGHWDGAAVEGEEERIVALRLLERRRTGQRVSNVSVEDGLFMREAVLERMRQSLELSGGAGNSGSGIDWISTAREIGLVYSGPLLELRTLLSTITDGDYTATSLLATTKSARAVLHAVWMPYYEYPSFSHANLTEAFGPSAPESRAAYERCRSQYEPDDFSTMTTSENITYTAISDVLTSICGTLHPPFLNTEETWFQYYNNYTSPTNLSNPQPQPSPSDLVSIHNTLLQTYHTIQELMAHLGWSDQWGSCSPACEIGQVCALPMWPVMGVVVKDPWEDEEKDGGEVNRTRRGWEGGLERALWEPSCVSAEIVGRRWERRVREQGRGR